MAKICLHCDKEAVFVIDFNNNVKAYLCDEHKHSIKKVGEIKLIDDTEETRKKYLLRSRKKRKISKLGPTMGYLRKQAFRDKEAVRQREYQQKKREFIKSLTPEQKEEYRLHAIDETYNRFIEKLRSKKSTE